MGRPFDALSPGAQFRRLRRLGEAALPQLGIEGPARLRALSHWENATFRVEAGGERFLLRVHSPDYNGLPAIRSELMWLRALRRDTDLEVPTPAAGPLLVEHPSVPDPRPVTLLRWVEGDKVGKRFGPTSARALGALIGRLHEHGARWRPPKTFARGAWDADGLFRWWPPAIHGRVVGQVGERERALFAAVRHRFEEATRALGRGADVYGLIHADLHPYNVVAHRGELRPIDFDDCRHGWFLYDLAVPMRTAGRLARDPTATRAALVAGYREVRSLSDDHAALLPLFELTRSVTIAWFLLWRGLHHAGCRAAAAEAVPDVAARAAAFCGPM